MKFSMMRWMVPGSLLLLGALASPSAAETPAPARLVAKIGDTDLTEDQMRKDLAPILFQVENYRYQREKEWIDQQAQTILFEKAAKEAGLSRKDWEAKEIDAKTPAPTDQEIQQLLKQSGRPVTSTGTAQNQADLTNARNFLTNQKKLQVRNQIYQELQKKYPVQILIEQPVAPRVNVTYSPDNPTKGNPKAPITIVEFTDFQCPWCKRSQDNVKAVEQAYGDKIKLVDRMFPLAMHPRAMPSAEAALCAKEQGKYWEFRDKLFSSQTLSDDDFKQFAKDLGLKVKKFESCMASHKYAAQVQNDISEGQRFGVQGTPTFFVNGLPTSFTELQNTVKNELDKNKS